MIDRTVYASWLTVLEEHYGKSFSPTIAAIYYKKFAEKLNTQQFETACEQTMMNERFFPPLQTFIDYGKKPQGGQINAEAYKAFAPAKDDGFSPDQLIANQQRLKGMVEGLSGKFEMPEQNFSDLPEEVKIEIARYNGQIWQASHPTFREQAVKRAICYADKTKGVAVAVGHDGKVIGIHAA